MQLLISQQHFAKICGCSTATPSRLKHKELKPAMVGPKINAAHPAALEIIHQFRQGNGRRDRNATLAPDADPTDILPADLIGGRSPDTEPAPKGLAARRERKKQGAIDTGGEDFGTVPEHIEAFADMTLRELIHRFGTDARFVDWLRATKQIEEIKERRTKNEKMMGELIPRDFVAKYLFGAMEESNTRLLNDSPRTIAATAAEMVEAGETLEQIEERVRELISSQIRNMKTRAKKALRNVNTDE